MAALNAGTEHSAATRINRSVMPPSYWGTVLRVRPILCLVAVAVAPVAAQRFEDAIPHSGIAFRHEASKTPRKYLPETMGGGVAIFDANLDGRMDVFFVNGAKLDFPHPQGVEPDKSAPRFWNRLYLNRGRLRFEDATERYGLQGRGYGMGAAVGDYDNDGDPDLLVTNAATGDVPAAILYRNEDGLGFSDVTQEAGIGIRGWATSAGFFDADNDGDLDLFVSRYMRWRFDIDRACGMEASYGRSYCHPDLFPPAAPVYYRNDGDGTFTDASEASGLADHPGKGLGVAFADYDQDGWIDVAVANDSYPQHLFRNLGDGTFAEDGLIAGMAYNDHGDEFAGMGILFEDLDDDGLPDLLVTTLSQERYALFYNAGAGRFDYYTGRSGLGRATALLAGWGLATLDADADGQREVFFANSHVMDNIGLSQPHVSYRQPPLLMKVTGRQMSDISSSAGDLFGKAWTSRGVAVGELDGDGLPDMVVSNLDSKPYLARNVTADAGHWIGIRLRGCASNSDGIGARLVLARPSGPNQYRTVTRAGSYLSSRDPRAFFGVGPDTEGIRLEVNWPSGSTSEVGDLQIDRVTEVSESPGCLEGGPSVQSAEGER